MAVNTSRSMNESLKSGSTDGKYRKVGYGFLTSEYPEDSQVNPGK
jgi:hypothetical protein